jgi:GxxExxY protein
LFQKIFFNKPPSAQRKMTDDEIGREIVDSALEVHRALGPGLLESAYESCLKHELRTRNIHVTSQQELPLTYKGLKMDVAYRLDLLVEEKVIVEIKAVDKLNDVHLAQILSYLRLTDLKLGFLINFNVKLIKEGIKRVANNFGVLCG